MLDVPYTKEEMQSAWDALSAAEQRAIKDRITQALRDQPRKLSDNYKDCMKGCKDMEDVITGPFQGDLSAAAAKAIMEQMKACYESCHDGYGVPRDR